MPNTIGILSPGDMGHTVGDVLRQKRFARYYLSARQKPTHTAACRKSRYHRCADVPAIRNRSRPYPLNHGASTGDVRRDRSRRGTPTGGHYAYLRRL